LRAELRRKARVLEFTFAFPRPSLRDRLGVDVGFDLFPPNITDAHKHSSNHRSEIEASSRCGCFYCQAQFAASEVVEWVDDDANGVGTSPRCGIDSVLGDRSGVPISVEFLVEMQRYWFSA
jgi:hypothetical protein